MRTMKLSKNQKELDAEIQLVAPTRVSFVVESRGGAKGSNQVRNPDYNEALEVLLERMGALGASLDDALIVSEKALRLYPRAADRRLALEFPISLVQVESFESLRLEICRSQISVARSPRVQDERKGNPTRRIALEFSLGDRPNLDAESISELVRTGR